MHSPKGACHACPRPLYAKTRTQFRRLEYLRGSSLPRRCWRIHPMPGFAPMRPACVAVRPTAAGSSGSCPRTASIASAACASSSVSAAADNSCCTAALHEESFAPQPSKESGNGAQVAIERNGYAAVHRYHFSPAHRRGVRNLPPFARGAAPGEVHGPACEGSHGILCRGMVQRRDLSAGRSCRHLLRRLTPGGAARTLRTHVVRTARLHPGGPVRLAPSGATATRKA